MANCKHLALVGIGAFLASSLCLWGTSDQLRGATELPIQVSRLSELRTMAEGTRVAFDATGGEKIVTTRTQCEDVTFPLNYFFYVEQEDRSAGIQLADFNTDREPTRGKQVSAVGTLFRDGWGNLYVDITDEPCTFSPATKRISPVGMNNQTVGGSDVTGGVGVPNVGILAATWGKVIDKGTDLWGNTWFVLCDGSGASVMCYDYLCDGEVANPGLDETWSVIGAVSLEKVGEDYLRTIIVDSARKQT